MGNRSRYFSGVSYASKKQIDGILRDHRSSIRACAYIRHDQDEAEPHFHILLRLHSAWTSTQIAKWFAGLKDKEKKDVNTFFEVCVDMDAQKDYILHQDAKSREEGKHEYKAENIISRNFDDISQRKDCYDSSYEILEKVLSGASIRELVRVYGRDYLYHHNQYSEVADNITYQEHAWDSMKKWREQRERMEEVKDMSCFEENKQIKI